VSTAEPLGLISRFPQEEADLSSFFPSLCLFTLEIVEILWFFQADFDFFESWIDGEFAAGSSQIETLWLEHEFHGLPRGVVSAGSSMIS
jgi:hypothetical protein